MRNIYSVVFKIIIVLIAAQLAINGSSCHKKRNKTAISQSSAGFTINAPSNLTATLVSSIQTDLSWSDNSGNEDGFEIERSENGASYYLFVTVSADVISYTDITLLPSTSYSYRVRAFNTIGDKSAYSDSVSIATPGEWSLISAGSDHVIAVKMNGSLWAWGRNDWYQLGLGDTEDKKIPYLIAIETDWQKISAGYYHNLSIKTNGSLWGWGRNYDGQLGFGTTAYDGDFIYQAATATDWSLVSAGGFFSLAIKSNNTLWSTGANDESQLGLGDTNIRAGFTQIGTLSDWSLVSAGFEYSLGVKTDNTLWSWGLNDKGQLGLGNTINKNTPTAVGTLSDWSNIYSGESHSLGFKSDNTLWAWGYNTYGQLGLGHNTNTYTPTQIGSDTAWQVIAAGGFHTLAIRTDGRIFSWGRNNYGQLGLGITNNRNSPTQINTESDWSTVCAGGYHSVALKNDNTIWVWGNNQYGQIGLGDTDDRYAPTKSGLNLSIPPSAPESLSSMLVLSGRIGLYWTDNANNETGFRIERKTDIAGTWNQIGTAGTNAISWQDSAITGLVSSFYRIKSFNDYGESEYSNETCVVLSGSWSDISAGDYHTIALRANPLGGATLWSWGSNSNGQLALATTAKRMTPSQIGTYSAWSIIGTGAYHTLSIRTDKTLWSWGLNDKGQLGLGDTIERFVPAQIGSDSDWSLISGNAHSLSIKTDRTLWAWGYNSWGQLGLGSSGAVNNRLTPAQIGTASDWANISAGSEHSLSVKTDNTLWSWGDNTFGELGIGSSGSSYNRTTPSKIGSDSTWINISAGGYSSLALKSNNTIWSWGLNNSGQLGLGGSTPRSTPSQIGTESGWQKIATYYTHSLAVKNNILYAWGRNDNGQLGAGDTENRSTPSMINSDTDWSVIKTGMSHSITIKTNLPDYPGQAGGFIWAWGDNISGQLGLGDNTDRNTPALNNY